VGTRQAAGAGGAGRQNDARDESGVLGRPRLAAQADVFVRRHFPALQYGADAVAWAVAVAVTTFLRYDMQIEPVNERGVVLVAAVAIGLQGAVGLTFGLYRRRFHYGSLEEVRLLATVMAIVAVLLLIAVRLLGGGSVVPRSVPLLAAFVAIVIGSVVRFVARLVEDQHMRPSAERSEPIVVFGASRASRQVIRTLMSTPDSPYRPVAVMEDDPERRGMRFYGLRVEGSSGDAAAIATRYGAESVLVADPGVTGEQLRELAAPWLEAGLQVLVVPPVIELVGRVGAGDIRPLTMADLLGRHEAEVDLPSIAGYITGRRVLVTGAGGSIGSELCRQLHAFGPATLVMLDRDESGLHRTQLSIEGQAMLDSPSLVLADIRDRDRIFEVFQHHRPEVVFHAAALKHLPLLEFSPAEGWKTNVVGTSNVLEAAEAHDVARLVNVSTDKAADPTSVLGFVKRICERMTAASAVDTGRRYVSVRFGNVLGSQGSMLGVFERQLADGRPLTVTHPEVTRFFMTIEEAVALTIQAGAVGEAGEVLVLDMGRPVRIEEVARRLADQAGVEPEIVYTGCARERSSTRRCSGPQSGMCARTMSSSARFPCHRCASTRLVAPARSMAVWCCPAPLWRWRRPSARSSLTRRVKSRP
jgi:FlaA1/EpsC-like NDP-sugar epimerase